MTYEPKHIVSVIFMLMFLVGALPYYVNAWRGNTSWLQRAARIGMSERYVKGVFRCGFAAVPFALLLCAALAVGAASKGPDGRVLGALGEPLATTLRNLTLGILFVGSVLTTISIFFNRPRWFVPPAFRSDPGLYHWLYGRRR